MKNNKLIAIIGMILLVLVSFVFAAPQIDFFGITLANNAITSNTTVEINISINESNLKDLVYNWNGTNYTMYNDSLLLMLNFDNVSDLGEGDNLNKTIDISNNDFSTNCSNMPSGCNYSSGKYGNAIGFDGIDDFVVTSANTPSLPFTICLWVNSNSSTPIGMFDSAPSLGNVIRNYDSGKVEWWDSCPQVTLGLSANTWTHLCFEFSHDGTNRYINWSKDGIKQTAGSCVGSSTFGWTTFRLGDINNGSSGRFAGYLDNFMIWNRSLNNVEISQLYTSNLQKFNSSQWYLYVNQSLNATDNLSDGNYTYQAHATNSSSIWNDTQIRTVSIDSTDPRWGNNKTNFTSTITLNSFAYFNITLNDTNPSSYTFSFYNGTTWVNDTPQAYIDTQEIQVIRNINSSPINWTWYINDTAGNINQTDVWNIVLSSSLGISMVQPTSAINISKNENYDVKVNVSCTGQISCGEINVTLDSDNTFIFDDFNSGEFGGDYWTTYRSDETNGRNGVNTTAAYSGSYSVITDSTTGNANLNELITNYDFTGSEVISVGFYWIEAPNGDSLDTGQDHIGNDNSDAVYFTCNGSYWHLLQNAPSSFTSWTRQSINVTADSDFCGTINESFKIKFTQYGNDAWPDSGIAWDDIRINMTYGNGGVISNSSSAYPFWTNNTNPRSISLGTGESQLVTFTVNATGVLNESFTFFAYANRTSLMSDSNVTSSYAVTIIEPDTTAPRWGSNETNLSDSITFNTNAYFNITLNDTSPDKYIFSFYNGTDWINDSTQSYTNAQEIEVVKNITTSPISWLWYVNDTSGNLNQTDTWTVTFNSSINLDLIYPTVNINVTQNTTFNVSVNVSCPGQLDCGEINVSLDPSTDRTPRTCSGVWGASCEGADPTTSDYSYDGCTSGAYYSSGFWVDEVYVDATTVAIGDTINITCDFDCYSTSSYNTLAISYYNGSWHQIWNQTNSCTDGNYSTTVVVSGNVGEQYARCQMSYDEVSTPTGTCFTPQYSDNDDVNFTVIAASKTGLINTTKGATPFYTNKSSNPYNISLTSGSSELVTFWVNATGTTDITHQFFVYANRTSKMSDSNLTNIWNVTILSPAAPTWSSNETNLTDTINLGDDAYFNITLSDLSPDKYIFSFYNGTHWANDSAQSFTNGQEIEVVRNINSTPIRWIWYINDTEGITNQTDSWEIILGSSIGIDLIYPTVDINVTQNEFFNVTVNVSCPSNIPCRGINVTLDPITSTIFSDDFESGEGDWTHGGTGDEWELGTPAYDLSSAHSGTNVWGTDLSSTTGNSNLYWLKTGNISISGATDLNLSFMHWYHFESCCDGSIVEASNDSNTWIKITPSGGYGGAGYSSFEPDYSGTKKSWDLATFDLSSFEGNDTIAFRFRFGSDGSVTNAGWYIDDINLTGITNPKGGIINTTAGATPFYTNISFNPYNISLLSGESEVITYYVNATGDGSNTYEFYAYANITSKPTITNETIRWNVTIQDNSTPSINYSNPITSNGTFKQNYIEVNVTAIDTHISTIVNYIYNTTGQVNSSSSTTSPHFTNFTSLKDGTYYLNSTATDSAGNANSTTTRIIILDTTPPPMIFPSPTPPNNTRQQDPYFEVNVSLKESYLDELIYNWNGINYTMYNDSLVLMYNFDNVSSLGENDTHVFDVSGHGNNGTAVNGSVMNMTGGRYEGAFQFDGVDDYVEFSDIPETNAGTISMWIKPNATINSSTNIDSGIFIDGDTTNTYGFMRFYDSEGNGSLDFHWLNGTGDGWTNSSSTTTTWNAGTWYHITGTWNSTSQQLYVNGVLENITTATNITSADKTLGVGVSSYGASYLYFNGTIDEFNILNRSLTAEEVSQQYISNLQRFNSSQWYLYVNQSKNATDTLVEGNYTYDIYSSDIYDNSNFSGERLVILDWTIPTFINFTNQSFEHSHYVGYDINASDLNNISCFSINDTTKFTINCTGYLANNTALLNGKYWLNVTINDSASNNHSDSLWINISDTIPPSFTVIANQTHEYGENFSYQITAIDSNNISCYTVNDSANFDMNCTGYLQNITYLNVSFYWLNITSNDTIGNKNSSIIVINVSDTTSAAINITYPINNTYTTDTNIAVNYTVSDLNLEACWYSNDTMNVNVTSGNCTNLTSITWTEAEHNITFWANDTYGNLNSSDVLFTVDLTSPIFTNISNQSIFEDDLFVFDINVSDTNPIGGFGVNNTNFSINSTGHLQNNTFFGQSLVGVHWLNLSVNDSAGNNQSTIMWINISDKGRVQLDMIYPLTHINVSQHAWFNVSANVSCIDNDCGEVNVSLVKEVVSSSEFFDGFEDGDIGSNWTILGVPGSINRTVIATSASSCGSPRTGTYFLTMDTSGSSDTTNIVKTKHDFTNSQNIVLDFWHHETGDEETTCSDHNGNDPNCDGYFYTCNGTRWFVLGNFPSVGSWTNVNVNISADADFCSEVNSSFSVKFTQRDEYGCTTDGRVLDDINISYQSLSQSTSPISTTNTTTPFYTNTTNPYNITLNNGQSALITFYVNASGTANTNNTLQVYANRTSDVTVSNKSIIWNNTITDTTNPVITNISNQTIEYNYQLSHDINATDFNNILCYEMNDTTFTINCTGFLTNNTLLNTTTYYLNVTVNDTYNNKDSETIWVNVTATTLPQFTNLDNKSSSYGSALLYDLDATDISGISCFTVNDTSRFSINCSGVLQNNTVLNESIYWINLTVNDTIGNKNYAQIYINVTNQDVIVPGVNITSPTNGTLFGYLNTSVALNVTTTENATCSYSIDSGATNYSMQLDDTINVSNSTISVSAGTNYTANVYCKDAQNNWNRTQSVTFTIDSPAIGIILLYPTSNINVSIGELFNITAKVNCTSINCGAINVSLDAISSSPFSTNTTNPNNISLNVNQTSTITFWVNSTTGLNTTNEFYIYANTTNLSINVSAQTSPWNVSIVDTKSPGLVFNPSTTANGTYNLQRNITVNVTADDMLLDDVLIYVYNATSLINTSTTSYISLTNLSYGTYYINATANDTSGNINTTETRTIIFNQPSLSISTLYPTMDLNVSQNEWFNVTINLTCLGQDCGDVNLTLDPVGVDCGVITNCDFTNTGDCSGQDGECTNIQGWTYYEVTDGTYESAVVATTSNPFGDKGNWLQFKSTFGGTKNTLWKAYIYSDTFTAAASYITYSFKGVEYDEWGYGLMLYEVGNETENFQLLEYRCPYEGSWDSSENVWGGCNDNSNYIPDAIIDKIVAINESLQDKEVSIKVWTGDGGTGDYGEASLDNICLSYENGNCVSSTKTTIPTTAGTIPFYTNKSTNPLTINLNKSNSTTTVFYVNATGRLNTSYDFFAYATALNDTSIRNDTATWNVTILDLTSPVLTFNSPSTAAGFFNLSEIVVNLTIGDTYFSNMTFYFYNGSGLINSTFSESSTLSLTYSNLSDGQYYINASALDSNGNTGYSETRSIYLDNVNPLLLITAPIDNFNTSNTNVNFTFNVTDSLTSNCIVYKDQADSIDYVSAGSNSSVNSLIETTINSSGFENRQYLWYLSCTDQAGNINTSGTRTLIVDTTGPSIDVSSPIQGGTSGYNIFLKTEVSDALSNIDSVWYFIYNNSNSSQQLTNGTLNGTDSWDSNWNSSIYPGISWNVSFNVYANDSLGNIGNKNISFLVDNSIPVIQFINPTTLLKYFNDNFSLSVNVQDNSFNYTNYSITKDGVLIQSNSTTLVTAKEHIWGDPVNVTQNQDGTYNITVYATDVAGNGMNSSTLFVMDQSNPTLTINYPAQGSYLNISQVNFNWTATDNISAIISCNLSVPTNTKTVSCTNSTNCNYTLSGFSEQLYDFNITCSDNASNLITANSNFTIDTIFPKISFDSSTTEAGNYSRNYIFIYANATEQNIDYLNITLYNSTFDIINTTSTTDANLSINVTGLANGFYYFNATINDSFGHTNATETRKILLDDTYPSLSIIVNDSILEYGSDSILINWSVNETYINSVIFNVTTSTSFLINSSSSTAGGVNLTNDDLVAVDNYTISLFALDTSGNSNVTNTTFEVADTTFPTADIVEPILGNYSRTWIYVNATSTDAALNYITIYLYNSTLDLINESTGATSPYTFNFTNLVDGNYSINMTACDDSRCNSSDTVAIELDTIAPTISFDSSTTSAGTYANNYIFVNVSANDSRSRLDTITINLFNISNVSINFTTNSSSPYILNLTNLSDGTYHFNASANDSLSNINSTATRTVILDSTYVIDDIDRDGIADGVDTILYNESNVTKSGFTQLNITIGGNATNNVFSGVQEIKFLDQNTLVCNFSHNLSQSNFSLGNISIIKTSTSLIINLSGQLQNNKTVYITDNDFIAICVKDAEVASITDVSSGCNGANETDFTTCLGNETAVIINGTTCIDEGTRLRFENLQYSAVRGTSRPTSSTPQDDTVSGGGGRGGGYVGDNVTEEELVVEKPDDTGKEDDILISEFIISSDGEVIDGEIDESKDLVGAAFNVPADISYNFIYIILFSLYLVVLLLLVHRRDEKSLDQDEEFVDDIDLKRESRLLSKTMLEKHGIYEDLKWNYYDIERCVEDSDRESVEMHYAEDTKEHDIFDHIWASHDEETEVDHKDKAEEYRFDVFSDDYSDKFNFDIFSGDEDKKYKFNIFSDDSDKNIYDDKKENEEQVVEESIVEEHEEFPGLSEPKIGEIEDSEKQLIEHEITPEAVEYLDEEDVDIGHEHELIKNVFFEQDDENNEKESIRDKLDDSVKERFKEKEPVAEFVEKEYEVIENLIDDGRGESEVLVGEVVEQERGNGATENLIYGGGEESEEKVEEVEEFPGLSEPKIGEIEESEKQLIENEITSEATEYVKEEDVDIGHEHELIKHVFFEQDDEDDDKVKEELEKEKKEEPIEEEKKYRITKNLIDDGREESKEVVAEPVLKEPLVKESVVAEQVVEKPIVKEHVVEEQVKEEVEEFPGLSEPKIGEIEESEKQLIEDEITSGAVEYPNKKDVDIKHEHELIKHVFFEQDDEDDDKVKEESIEESEQEKKEESIQEEKKYRVTKNLIDDGREESKEVVAEPVLKEPLVKESVVAEQVVEKPIVEEHVVEEQMEEEVEEFPRLSEPKIGEIEESEKQLIEDEITSDVAEYTKEENVDIGHEHELIKHVFFEQDDEGDDEIKEESIVKSEYEKEKEPIEEEKEYRITNNLIDDGREESEVVIEESVVEEPVVVEQIVEETSVIEEETSIEEPKEPNDEYIDKKLEEKELLKKEPEEKEYEVKEDLIDDGQEETEDIVEEEPVVEEPVIEETQVVEEETPIEEPEEKEDNQVEEEALAEEAVLEKEIIALEKAIAEEKANTEELNEKEESVEEEPEEKEYEVKEDLIDDGKEESEEVVKYDGNNKSPKIKNNDVEENN